MPFRNTPLLLMRNIHVRYNDCLALKGVDFDLFRGEIHGLVGEHRAGKSTLVKLLSGAVRKEGGTIVFNGAPIENFTPQSAIRHKIGIVYQDITVLPTLNAVDNLFAGRSLTNWWGGVQDRAMKRQAEALFARMGMHIPLDIPVENLSKAEQYMVELAKVLSIDPEVLIFDEISTKLTPNEMENIYTLLSQFKQHGKSVIYISHNMDEIFDMADRVTILHNGRKRGTEVVKDLDKVKLIKLTYSFVLSREELEHDNRELYLLKKYNEDVIKNLPEGVVILDPDNMVYMINYAALHILDLERDTIQNQSVDRIFQASVFSDAEGVLQNIQAREAFCWEEMEYGDEKILKLHIFPFKDDDHTFLGTILILQDISKERYLNDYLLRTERIASVAALGAGVAHEINNPLGIIRNYVAYLKEQPLGGESLERVDRIEHELYRIVEIIEGLLSFSKFNTLPMKRINLTTVLHEVITLVAHTLKEKEIHLTWNPPADDVPIVGDENRLKQVFINLLVNSAEAVMHEGMIELRMTLHQEEQYVEVSVTDNGYGIPDDVSKKMFDPFFSTKAGKNNSGLGLSICHHIIEAHHGLITCSSGEHTTLNVRLPLLEEST